MGTVSLVAEAYLFVIVLMILSSFKVSMIAELPGHGPVEVHKTALEILKNIRVHLR